MMHRQSVKYEQIVCVIETKHWNYSKYISTSSIVSTDFFLYKCGFLFFKWNSIKFTFFSVVNSIFDFEIFEFRNFGHLKCSFLLLLLEYYQFPSDNQNYITELPTKYTESALKTWCTTIFFVCVTLGYATYSLVMLQISGIESAITT